MITTNAIYCIKTRPKESGISCGERREYGRNNQKCNRRKTVYP